MNPTGNPDLDALAQQVQSNTDAEASAVTLLNRLGDLIRQNANNPAALRTLADSLIGSAANLSAAIVANTPADPNTPPSPGPATTAAKGQPKKHP